MAILPLRSQKQLQMSSIPLIIFGGSFSHFFFISRQGWKYLFLLNLFKNSNIYLLLVVQWIDPQLKELIKSTMFEINVNDNSHMQDPQVKRGKDNQKLQEW